MEALKQTITKDELLKELKWHQEQDNFVRGKYFENGKGCAVGCSLETLNRTKGINLIFSDHSQYPIHLGIPEWLARVEDEIFEGVSVERSKTWALEFIEAINPGSNLEKIKASFSIFILKSNLNNFNHNTNLDVVKVINTCIKLWEKYPEVPLTAWSAAKSAARAAAADCKSESAINAASSAAWSVEFAATSDAWSADINAVMSVEFAVEFAARSASGVVDKTTIYEQFADELLRLIRQCK